MRVVLPFWHGSDPTLTELTERMAAWGVPGLSIAVFERGEIVRAQGFGVLQAGLEEAVTPDTLFQAGSIGKAVTAVAVLRLVQQGLLDLDADVNRYLHDWKVPAGGTWQPRITLRQLLSHSAGTTVHGFVGYRAGESVPTVRQILDGAPPAKNRPVRVDTLPGTHFRYSGGGTMIVQAVLMEVSGLDFHTLMREIVFDPLRMIGSTFERPLPASLEARASSAHWFGSDVAGTRYYVHPEAAAAGLWSTPSDLARLAIGVQSAWAGTANGFLRPDLVLEMLLPQGAPHIGLGFFLSGESDGARFGHSGDTFGFMAELTCFRETGQGAAIMANSITASNVITEVFRTLADERGWPALGTARCSETDDKDSRAASIVGSYKLDSGMRIAIDMENGTPVLQVEGQDPIRLRVCSDDAFIAHDIDLTVRMLPNTSTLRLEQGNSTLQAHPA